MVTSAPPLRSGYSFGFFFLLVMLMLIWDGCISSKNGCVPFSLSGRCGVLGLFAPAIREVGGFCMDGDGDSSSAKVKRGDGREAGA